MTQEKTIEKAIDKLKDKTIGYAFLHFWVDFCCALFVCGIAGGKVELYRCFLVYNFCAFALQMPVGLLADRFDNSEKSAYLGCIVTAGAGLLSVIFSTILSEGEAGIHTGGALLLVLLAGVGNCLFHVGAGKEVLEENKERLSPLGIFVAPGAVGIFLGPRLAETNPLFLMIIYGLLLAAGLYLLWNLKIQSKEEKSRGAKCGKTDEKGAVAVQKQWILPALFCLFLVVVLRSYMGLVSDFPFQRLPGGSLLLLLALVLGKVAGGLLADKIGTGKTIVFSMCAASIGFFLPEISLFGLLGVFFFHMSMPITLYLAAAILHEYKGFSFGLLTFAIFVGFLPVYFGYGQGGRLFPVVVSLISLILLCAGWFLGQKSLGQKNFGRKELGQNGLGNTEQRKSNKNPFQGGV